MSADAPAPPEPCRWCGDQHGKICPWVKALEFDDPSGLVVRRVEFFSPVEMFGKPEPVAPPEGDYPKARRASFAQG